jgi:hypothetical protein
MPYGKRRVSQVIEDEISVGGYKIPISPYVHPAGLQELAALSCKYKNSAVSIAMFLVSLLKKREQLNVIAVSYDELAKVSGLSLKTVAVTMQFLIEHKFITKVTKQSYKISPKLAWFGNQVDWAVELKELNKQEGASND